MRICKIYDDDYPWDVRVEKVGRALVEGGHQVALATRNRRRAQRHEYVDTMDVWRMPLIPVLPEKIDVQLMFPAFFSPRWISHVDDVVRRNRCDALLVRDLPLALTAIGVARARGGLPVVLDMAENYPAALRAIHEHKTPTIGDHLARNPHIAQLIEDLALPLLSHTLVVCDENRERLINKGVPPDRVTVVGNTPDLRVFQVDEDIAAEAHERFSGDFVLVYIGAIDPFRGLDTIIDALAIVRDRLEVPNLRLAILGRGDGRPAVEEHARRVGVDGIVDFIGFRPLTDLPGFIREADLCVIPHHRNDHIDTTLPNKLFDAMALGRPVLATDALPLRRIIEGEECGLVYKSGDPRSAAEAILALGDEAKRTAMGERGKAAALSRYNWERDSAILVDVFKQGIGR